MEASPSSSGSDEPSLNRIAWELRLVRSIPLPPFAAGLCVSLGLVVVVLSIDWVGGSPIWRPGAGVELDALRNLVIVSLLVGYTMAAGRYLPVAIVRDLQEAGRIDPTIDPDREPERVLGLDGRTLLKSRAAGVIGLLLCVGLIESVRWLGADASSPPGGRLGVVVLPALLGFLLARAAFNTLHGSLSGSFLALVSHGTEEVDLLDMRPLHAEGRIGLRLALVWIVGSTIASLFFFDPVLVAPVLPMLGLGCAIALLALMLPVRRLQHRIHDAKRRELEGLANELRAARDRVRVGDATEGRLADLLSYRAYVEGIREWPFDNVTVIRFVLYLLIPVGSWLGGAMVERLVSSLLD